MNKFWLKMMAWKLTDMSNSQLAAVRHGFMEAAESVGMPENEALDAWRFMLERRARRRVEAI